MIVVLGLSDVASVKAKNTDTLAATQPGHTKKSIIDAEYS
jgi:hypothetical protein